MLYNCGPVLVSLATFTTYAALGHPLTAGVAFPALVSWQRMVVKLDNHCLLLL